MNNTNEENKDIINQRRIVNRTRYDELTIRQNLLLSVYPNLEEAPETIKKEIDEIKFLKQYLKDGVIGARYGAVMIDGLYIDSFQKENYESAVKELHRLQKENETYITKQQEAEFNMPTYNIEEYLEQVRNASDKPGEVVVPSEKIEKIISLCTYDQSVEFERKLKEASNAWATKIYKEKEEKKEKQRLEQEQRKQAIEEATERYGKLSIFGKIKAKITGQGISHIHDLSTDEINSMYKGKKNKRKARQNTQEIASEAIIVPDLEPMSELSDEQEKTVLDEQTAREQWRKKPSQQTYYDYKNEIAKRLEKEKNNEEQEKENSKESIIQDTQESEKQIETPSAIGNERIKQSPITEYETAKESFEVERQNAQLLQQEKSSKEIDEDIEDFERREKRIRKSHFTDAKKEELIKELYSEFDEYTEQNPELSGRHM